MEWTGEGLLIGVCRHGETSVIAEAMVVGRGRCLGLVRGGRSARMSATLQPGNDVQLTWRARLENHLGLFAVELLRARAAELIADRNRLYAAQLLFEHLRLLPERDPHDQLLARALDILGSAEPFPILMRQLARFELFLLEELGFGLDLTECAMTGETGDLAFVSPKTGRAATAAAGAPYRDRLLALPAFLTSDAVADMAGIDAAFRLTGHFLNMHVWTARQIAPPPTRDALISEIAKRL